jgi:protein-tyrosine-phosphatase
MVLLRAKVQTINEDRFWRIGSVGTWTENGIPIIRTVEGALHSVGLDPKGHYSRIVTEEILSSFQLILTMERGQKEALQIEFQEHAVRTYMLSEMIWLQEDVPDPKDRSLPGIQNTIGLINYYIDQGWHRIYNLSKEIIPIKPHTSAPNFR